LRTSSFNFNIEKNNNLSLNKIIVSYQAKIKNYVELKIGKKYWLFVAPSLVISSKPGYDLSEYTVTIKHNKQSCPDNEVCYPSSTVNCPYSVSDS